MHILVCVLALMVACSGGVRGGILTLRAPDVEPVTGMPIKSIGPGQVHGGTRVTAVYIDNRRSIVVALSDFGTPQAAESLGQPPPTWAPSSANFELPEMGDATPVVLSQDGRTYLQCGEGTPERCTMWLYYRIHGRWTVNIRYADPDDAPTVDDVLAVARSLIEEDTDD